MIVNGCSSVNFGKRPSLPSIKPGKPDIVKCLGGSVPPAINTRTAAKSDKPYVGKGFFGKLHDWIYRHFLNIKV